MRGFGAVLIALNVGKIDLIFLTNDDFVNVRIEQGHLMVSSDRRHLKGWQ